MWVGRSFQLLRSLSGRVTAHVCCVSYLYLEFIAPSQWENAKLLSYVGLANI